MREINFRAWDGNRMRLDGFIIWDGMPHEFSEYSRDDVYKRDWHLMQYTGLKDRNGKEIYEGDILSGGMEVKWSVSGWWAVPVPFNRHPDRLFPLNIEAEVIGNIHENPDLLDG